MQSSINLDHVSSAGEIKGEGLDGFGNHSASQQLEMKPVNLTHLFPPPCPNALRIFGWGWRTQALRSVTERRQQLLLSCQLPAQGWDLQSRTESPEMLLQGHAEAACSAQPCHTREECRLSVFHKGKVQQIIHISPLKGHTGCTGNTLVPLLLQML